MTVRALTPSGRPADGIVQMVDIVIQQMIAAVEATGLSDDDKAQVTSLVTSSA
jgi:hypothetical protein